MLSSSTADAEDTPSVGIAITSESKDADELSEWPPLANVADPAIANDHAVDWLEHAYPPELNDIPTGTPKDVIWIVKESLDKERHRAPSIDPEPERKRSWRNSFEPKPKSPSIPPENRSASRRNHSVSQSSQFSSAPSENSNASSKSTPGYTVKMGPLGWIVVPDKTEDIPKKSKSTREGGGLKKYLKDRNKSG